MHVFQQQGEVGDFAIGHQATVGVDVLPQQGDFLHPLLGEPGNFGQHVFKRAGNFLATGIGHHAEGAVLGASFHDGYECSCTIHLGWRNVVEFFDFREGNIHLRCTAVLAGANHVRQTVQGLRAEHHIHIRRALDDGVAFLAGHAAANANDQVGPGFFQRADAAQIGEHFFLCLFPHATGVEQDDVGFFRIVCLDHAFGIAQNVDHFVRVVFVHLATEGLDVYLLHCLQEFQLVHGGGRLTAGAVAIGRFLHRSIPRCD